MKIALAVIVILVFSSGCATPPPQASEPEKPRTLEIDYAQLQSQLGIETPAGGVGYREKVFDACDLADRLPPLEDCHHAYFIITGLQLSCRSSEESNSILSTSDLEPVANRALKWKAGKNHGQTETDREGFVLIQAISGSSMKRRELRISTGKDFLVIVANQSTNIVTPHSWCE